MAIIWDEKYSVRISIIDEQHKQFVLLMDKLSKTINVVNPKETLSQIIKELERYAVYHFNTEEKYFIEFNYLGKKEHIEAHRNFVEKLEKIKEKHHNDVVMLSIELVTFMSDWLVNHVQDMDKKYIECFHENGLY